MYGDRRCVTCHNIGLMACYEHKNVQQADNAIPGDTLISSIDRPPPITANHARLSFFHDYLPKPVATSRVISDRICIERFPVFSGPILFLDA